jgi:hypothetical protein
MTHSFNLRPALGITALSLLVALTGCKTNPVKPDQNAKPEVKLTQGKVIMPSRFRPELVDLADKGQRAKIYTEIKGIGIAGNEKLLLQPAVLSALNLTDSQIQRRFMDTIGKTRRYDVYDISATVVADQSDYVVDAQFVDARQELRTIEGGARVAITRVQLNANLVQRYNRDPVWEAPVEAVGVTGQSSLDRRVVMPGMSLSDPAVQRMLGDDYNEAIQRALDVIAASIDRDLRPMGKVIGTAGDGLTIVGGTRNGLQRGDELVVFRAEIKRFGKQVGFNNMQPMAALRCNGVGSVTSQCDIVRRNPGFQVREGDFVVLTDHSADRGKGAQ